jgi:CheY-like chemotaxis protein
MNRNEQVESIMAISKKNILVADNDPDTLKAVRFHLKTMGYQVFTASNPTQALQMLEDEIIHLAIIDLRLKNDRELEYSGLEVAEKVPDHIPFIIYTAFEETWIIKKALGKVGAKDIIDKKKQGAASKLIDAVNRIFKADVKVNFDLVIDGLPTCEEIAEKIKIPSKEGIPPTTEDVRLILESLFYTAESIKISPLGSAENLQTEQHSGSLVVLIQPRYRNGPAEKRVVKFNKKSEILMEEDGYNKISPYLVGTRLAVLGGTAVSRSIGGASYTVIKADWENIRQFNEYYNECSAEKICQSLDGFFSHTFSIIFNAAEKQRIDIASMYCKGLHLDAKKLKVAMETMRPQDCLRPDLHFNGLAGSFPNPATWLLPYGEFRNFERESKVCLCHGDLHSGNILVDSGQDFWLIDFTRVDEKAHALRDFVELETDIKFTLLSDTDMADLYSFEHALLVPRHFGEEVPTFEYKSPSLEKAHKVISALRMAAAKSLGLEGEMSEYYEALLFNTLKILRFRQIQGCKKEHALLAASLICKRLDRWPEWNPAILSPSEGEHEEIHQD